MFCFTQTLYRLWLYIRYVFLFGILYSETRMDILLSYCYIVDRTVLAVTY